MTKHATAPIEVFASVHEGMRNPQFNNFAEDIGEIGGHFYATDGTGEQLERLGLSVSPAEELLASRGRETPEDLSRPELAGRIAGLIAAGESGLHIVWSTPQPPGRTMDHTDFGGQRYQTAAVEAGDIAIVTDPSQYQSVVRLARAGILLSDEVLAGLKKDAIGAAFKFHAEAFSRTPAPFDNLAFTMPEPGRF